MFGLNSGNSAMPMLFGGAALGAVASAWGQVKAVCWKIANLFIQRVNISDRDLAFAVNSYLVTHYRRSKLYDKLYSAAYENMVKDGRAALVPFEFHGRSSVIMWNRHFPFYYAGEGAAPKVKAGEQPQSNNEEFKTKISITFIRGTLDTDKLIADATQEANQLRWENESVQSSQKKRFFVKHLPERKSGGEGIESGSNIPFWFRQSRYRLIGFTTDELGPRKQPGNGTSLSRLVFPAHITNLIEDIKMWRSSKEWYQVRNIPWKHGWIIFGTQGCGKTALARAFGEDLDMPIFVYHLGEMHNDTMMESWRDMQQFAPCIALIEDIDNVFHGRKNIAREDSFSSMMYGPRRNSKKKKGASPTKDGDDEDESRGSAFGALTFDCLLNCLDGVERAEGVFTIVTTNDITKIDEALGVPVPQANGNGNGHNGNGNGHNGGGNGTTSFISTRPGRLDKAIELGYMDQDCKHRLAIRILDGYPEALTDLHQFIDSHPDLQETPAQFQDRCTGIALHCHWNKTNQDVADKAESVVPENCISPDELESLYGESGITSPRYGTGFTDTKNGKHEAHWANAYAINRKLRPIKKPVDLTPTPLGSLSPEPSHASSWEGRHQSLTLADNYSSKAESPVNEPLLTISPAQPSAVEKPTESSISSSSQV